MDDNVHRENGRHKTDHYKSVHAQGWQWMMPQHQAKDSNALKLMALMAERDNAIQECNIALSEKRAAFAERDMAILQRDGALSERNAAVIERNNALAALKFARENTINDNGDHPSPEHHLPLQLPDERPMHVIEAHPISTASDGCLIKARKPRRSRKETKNQKIKEPKKGKRKRSTAVKPIVEWRGDAVGGGDDLNKQSPEAKYQQCSRVQDLVGLNQVPFDESMMPPPGCSCTGRLQHCYKWGNGGWQSACCTKTLSMHPLPVMPNKRHARVAGRKMSGSAFAKLLAKLAAEGFDPSAPLDLKDHWAKHGTNSAAPTSFMQLKTTWCNLKAMIYL